MNFLFEITAKIEAMRLTGESQFTFQGRLSVEHDGQDMSGEPLNMGLNVPHDVWSAHQVGDVLRFGYNGSN